LNAKDCFFQIFNNQIKKQMNTILQKWWFTLLQGLLLIVLSFYVFNHPGATLLSLSFWISVLILAGGIAGIVAWFGAEKTERDQADLWWSIASLLFGLLLLAKIGFAMNLFTNLLGIWMALTGFWLAQKGWAIKDNGTLGWIILALGILSIIIGIMVIANIRTGAVAVSTIFGIQLLLVGIGLVLFAFLKKHVAGRVKGAASKLGLTGNKK
jgi:uncharacterized membrane protein HdeD (DUF308 family)